jgi:UDP-glucuronate 4-epimerase
VLSSGTKVTGTRRGSSAQNALTARLFARVTAYLVTSSGTAIRGQREPLGKPDDTDRGRQQHALAKRLRLSSLHDYTGDMLQGEKILITGATGKVAFPIARALAGCNEVWGAARFSKPRDRERLQAIGARPLQLDMASGVFAGVADDFTYVFHAAVDPGLGEWARCLRTNAQHSGRLLAHCRRAKGFVLCSTGSIYAYKGQRPLTEADGPGAPLRANYSFSKVAAEAVCSALAEQLSIPLTIIRICSTYGPEGGTPVDRLQLMLQGKAIRLHPDRPNNYNPIYEDDYVQLGIRAMEVAGLPPVVVNWAGSETVSIEDYCAYMGELVGVRPIFEYTPDAHTPLWPDVTHMHEVLGRTKIHWRDGFRRMIEARHPELLRK